jgi:hypothetical protein
MVERTRRVLAVAVLCFAVAVSLIAAELQPKIDTSPNPDYPAIIESASTENAADALAELTVKGRAPRSGYEREQFGAGWSEIDGCDTRNVILARDLTDVIRADDGCKVLSGVLIDSYTSKTINFQRGASSSSAVQIDHVVALSDAWQKGAQNMDVAIRTQFANDPLNLLAVDGPANQQKSDSDAASWLPPNREYRCRFIARQIAVKREYNLWVTAAERDAMQRVLAGCPAQVLPIQTVL